MKRALSILCINGVRAGFPTHRNKFRSRFRIDKVTQIVVFSFLSPEDLEVVDPESEEAQRATDMINPEDVRKGFPQI